MSQCISGNNKEGPAIRHSHKKSFMLVLVAAISLAACTKDAHETGPGTLRQEGQAASPQSQTGALNVRIVPDAPTVLTDLQVAASCAGTAMYQWQKNGLVLDGERSDRLSRDRFLKGDRISVILMTGSGQGEATVTIGNSPPSVASVPFNPERIYAGVDITVSPVGYDPDGDTVGFRYQWTINDKDVPGDTPVLKGALFKRGDKINLIVIPYDRDSDGKPFVSQNLVVPNAPPRIISDPPEFHGGVYTYQVIAEDPEGDPLTYSLASALPGMTIDGRTGMITWKIDENSAGTHAVEIVAQDPGGLKASQKYSLTITLTNEGAGK